MGEIQPNGKQYTAKDRIYILLVRQTHDFHGHGVLGCVMSGVFELESSEAPSQFYTTSKRKIYHNFFFIKSLQFTHVIL